MLEKARELAPAVPRSVEIEKPRADIEQLFPYADVLLFSRHFATSRGYDDPQRFLDDIARQTPAVTRTLAWSEAGAYALDRNGRIFHSPAYPPPQLVDTLGAGDTFNAGVIDALLQDTTVAEALQRACRLAGRKCGQPGLAFART